MGVAYVYEVICPSSRRRTNPMTKIQLCQRLKPLAKGSRWSWLTIARKARPKVLYSQIWLGIGNRDALARRSSERTEKVVPHKDIVSLTILYWPYSWWPIDHLSFILITTSWERAYESARSWSNCPGSIVFFFILFTGRGSWVHSKASTAH